MKRRFARFRCLAPCLAALLLTIGCEPPIGPTETGGEPLLRATGMGAALGGGYFSVSPDGKRIFYPIATGSKARYPTSYVVYDVSLYRATPIEADASAQALLDKAAFVGLGCWSEDSKKVTIPGRSGSLQATVVRSKPKWTVTEPVRNPMAVMKACSNEARVAERVRVVKVSKNEVQIVDAEKPERVYATHSMDKIGGVLEIVDLNLSPSGKALSYVVQDAKGSLGGYVLSLRSGMRKPRFLAPQVLGLIQWTAGETHILACIRESRTQNAIYRWKS